MPLSWPSKRIHHQRCQLQTVQQDSEIGDHHFWNDSEFRSYSIFRPMLTIKFSKTIMQLIEDCPVTFNPHSVFRTVWHCLIFISDFVSCIASDYRPLSLISQMPSDLETSHPGCCVISSRDWVTWLDALTRRSPKLTFHPPCWLQRSRRRTFRSLRKS